MGRVLAGEFEGGKVKILDGYKCLCIKTKEGTRPLDSTRVKSYQMKEIIHNPFTTLDRTFLIQWKDGTKSIIALESAYVTLLVTGCEAVEVPEELPQKVKGGWLAFWLALFIVGLVFFGIFRDVFSNSSEETEKTEKLTWSEWDRAGQRPSADMLVETTESLGLAQDAGVVSGYFINNSNKTYRHLEAIYGVYNSNGNRIGRCTFSTNDVYLAPNQEQGFTATCNAWGDSPIIKLESVGFKEKPLTS